MNITADNWAVLWGGIGGAIIGGGVAAVVALWVLNRTKKHQAELAASQLSEQRREGALAREIAARAEIIELSTRFSTSGKTSNAAELDRSLTVKINQWRIDLSAAEDAALRSELKNWGGLLSSIESTIDVDDPEDESQYYRSMAFRALQQVSINFRHDVDGVLWDSAHCAQELKTIRQQASEYVEERHGEWAELERLSREAYRKERRDGES